jgi:uncharacterized phage-like protein YoqJ
LRKIIPAKTVFFTGHRNKDLFNGLEQTNPHKLSVYEYPRLQTLTESLVQEFWNAGYDTFISGGAIGFDQIAANAVLEVKRKFEYDSDDMRIIIARPFPSQDAVWPSHVKECFRALLAKVDCVVDVDFDPYAPWKMQKRNEWMVDQASVGIACWNGKEHGGTWNCIQYARKKQKPLVCINPNGFEVYNM